MNLGQKGSKILRISTHKKIGRIYSAIKKNLFLFNQYNIFAAENIKNNVMSYLNHVNAAAEHQPYCPACESKNFVMNGTRKGVQNYRCKDCGKYFNGKTGSIFQYLKKPKLFFQFAKNYENRSSIRKDATKLKVNFGTVRIWGEKISSITKQWENSILLEKTQMFTFQEFIESQNALLQEVKKKKTLKNSVKNIADNEEVA